jgi:hypothetical protein
VLASRHPTAAKLFNRANPLKAVQTQTNIFDQLS